MNVFIKGLDGGIFELHRVLLSTVEVRSTGLLAQLTFLETVYSFSTVRRLVFAFDFLDALVGFLGFEFGVSVAVRELGGLASGVGLLCVGEAVVFHLLNLTNNYITIDLFLTCIKIAKLTKIVSDTSGAMIFFRLAQRSSQDKVVKINKINMSSRSLKKKGSQSFIQEPIPQQTDPSLVEPQPEEEPDSIEKQELDEKRRKYFEKMANKLQKGRQLAEKAVMEKEESFNEEILEGKYDIKERQWSSADENLKNSRSRLVTSSVQLKKDLENQLHNVESRILEEEKDKAGKMMSQEEHQNFMKKMEQKRKEAEQRRIELAKQEEQNRIEEENRQKEQMEKLELEKKNKKRQQLMEKLKLLEQHRRKQAEQYQQSQQALKEKIAEKTLAQKIENKYQYRQNQFLEEKKKRLAQIRALHKPIDKNQLDAFSQRLDQLHQEKQQARKSQQKLNSSKSVFYKSVFYKKIQSEQKKYGDSRHEEQLNKLKDARDKLKRYAEHVKSDYRPSIDEKKAEEIKFRNQSLKHRSFSSGQNLTQTPRRIGLRYLQYNKINHKLLGSTDDLEVEEESESKVKKIDYLAELRERNKNAHQMTAHGLLQKLERKQLPRDQKAKCIMDFTQKLQKKAKMREEIEKVGGGVSEQLDSLYLQAIEAKLSLLDLDE